LPKDRLYEPTPDLGQVGVRFEQRVVLQGVDEVNERLFWNGASKGVKVVDFRRHNRGETTLPPGAIQFGQCGGYPIRVTGAEISADPLSIQLLLTQFSSVLSLARETSV
jgi:hypothetical protein